MRENGWRGRLKGKKGIGVEGGRGKGAGGWEERRKGRMSRRGSELFGGFIKGIIRGVRCAKSLIVLFLHRRPPSWTTLVLYSRAVFIFNEPAYRGFLHFSLS